MPMAVGLKLWVSVVNARGQKSGYAYVEFADDFDVTELHGNHDGDANAATRRAIVRAAAEIGKAMP